MRRRFVLPLCLAVGAAGAVHAAQANDAALAAETPEAVQSILTQLEITLADLFRLAELTSPVLVHARSGVEVEAGRAKQAGVYSNPTVEFEAEEVEIDDPDVRKDKVALVQPLIVGGRRGAAVEAARAKQVSAEYALQNTRRDVFARIHRLWAEQLYFRELESALTELQRVAARTLEIAETRFTARAAPESHVTKALLEVYELEAARQQLSQERVRATAELTAALGGAQLALERLVGTLAGDSTRVALEPDTHPIQAHPALAAANKEVDSATASLREARAARIPDLELFMAYGQFRPADEGFFEAGLSIPLPLFDRNQGRIGESRALVIQAEQRARMLENELQTALAVARRRYRSTHEQLAVALARIVPAAERGLAQSQEGYRVGRLPFLELVDAQRTLTDVRRRTLELQRDLIVAEAGLMSLIGAGPYGDTGEE